MDWINCYSLLNKTEKEFSSRSRCSAIKAESKFIQIIVQMRGANRSLVCPQQPAFKQRCYDIAFWQQIFTYISLISDYFVSISNKLQSVISIPSIRAYDTASCYRSLKTTIRTVVQFAICFPSFFMLTTWAYESIWPPKLKKIFSASLFRAKSLFKFHKNFRVIFHTPIYYIL